MYKNRKQKLWGPSASLSFCACSRLLLEQYPAHSPKDHQEATGSDFIQETDGHLLTSGGHHECISVLRSPCLVLLVLMLMWDCVMQVKVRIPWLKLLFPSEACLFCGDIVTLIPRTWSEIIKRPSKNTAERNGRNSTQLQGLEESWLWVKSQGVG